jgi:hypothetical protein
VKATKPSAITLAERDRRAAYVPTLTELICGDPKPGQSALYKKLAEKGLRT